ncbi:hypothetical protein ACG3SL_09875 [Sphingomonas sp. CJ20]
MIGAGTTLMPSHGLLRCVRAASLRLRPALAAARARRPGRERWVRPLRRFEPLALVPGTLPATARYYLPAHPRPNSKAAAVVAELCAAGVPRAAIWTRDEDRARRPLRVAGSLPSGLALLWRIARRAPHLDDVQQQIVLGREAYRRFLRRNPQVTPIIISDVSPELHMLWSAAAAEGNRALWWQDDFHHRGPLAQPVRHAAVLNEAGAAAVRAASPDAFLVRRDTPPPHAPRCIPARPVVGVAVNASFAADAAQRGSLERLREALGAGSIVLRLHPNSMLAGAASPAPWIEVAPRDETLAAFSARIDLCVVGNSAVQLRLLCAGVPVLHVAGLDDDGHDLYGYCAAGLVFGAAADIGALNGFYQGAAAKGMLAAHVGVGLSVTAGLESLPHARRGAAHG